MLGYKSTCTQNGIFLSITVGSLDNIVVEPTYLSYVSATSFDSTNPEMATIVHRARGDHPKFFLCYNIMGLICSFKYPILGILLLSQNRVGRFFWKIFILTCLRAILVLGRFIFVIKVCLVAQYIVVLKTSYVLLCYLLEE